MNPVDVYVRAVERVWLAEGRAGLTFRPITQAASEIAGEHGVVLPSAKQMVYNYRGPDDWKPTFGSMQEVIEVAQQRSVGELNTVVRALSDDPVAALVELWLVVAVRPVWLRMLLTGAGPAGADEGLVELRDWVHGSPLVVAAWLGAVAADVHGFMQFDKAGRVRVVERLVAVADTSVEAA